MLFSSITFLYFFLPTVFILYGSASRKQDITGRNLVLCVMSCLFYAWGEPVYLFLMLAQVLIVYGLTSFMEEKRESVTGKVCFVLSVLIPFASLFYFKYTAFFMNTLTAWFAWPESWVNGVKGITLPIGISFYTFQLTSYCIDVWLGRVKLQKNLLSLMTYVSLFPQLIAGPIVRYSDVERELADRRTTRQDFAEGIVRFTLGLGKKVLIANVLGEFVTEAMALEVKGIALSWAYALAVSLQIYFDFSGYSDMAIGLGRMFGFHFPENFRYPFISGSLTEFWRRWHMTLGGWFRDYVYIPMGGNRVKKFRWVVNILTVWLLTGLWHGAAWNFVLWGLLFACLLLTEKWIPALQKLPHILRHLYVLFLVCISFVLFNGETLTQVGHDFMGMFGFGGVKLVTEETLYYLGSFAVLFAVGIVGATPLVKRVTERIAQTKWGVILEPILLLALLLLCTAYLVDGSFSPFLYFRF